MLSFCSKEIPLTTGGLAYPHDDLTSWVFFWGETGGSEPGERYPQREFFVFFCYVGPSITFEFGIPFFSISVKTERKIASGGLSPEFTVQLAKEQQKENTGGEEKKRPKPSGFSTVFNEEKKKLRKNLKLYLMPSSSM